MLYDLENVNTFYDFYGIQINHEAGSIGISFFRSQFNLVLDYVSTLSFVNEYHNHSSLWYFLNDKMIGPFDNETWKSVEFFDKLYAEKKNKLQIMCLNDAPFYKNMLVFDNTRHDALNEMRHLRGI